MYEARQGIEEHSHGEQDMRGQEELKRHSPDETEARHPESGETEDRDDSLLSALNQPNGENSPR